MAAMASALLAGRYQLGEVIGRGGMAEVHRGRDVRLGRDVAIKLLRPDLARDPSFQGRFRREAQAAASLNHPAIVAVYDTGEDTRDGVVTPYIVMEYVEGRTLRDVLAAEGQLQPQRALEITAQICAALEQAHQAGIVHRDIKPANVMLTPAGEVKVMDFGIARAVTGASSTMTQTAAVIGTAHYLSPEQARGEHVDARSDIYSTGCMLYELLTGGPPFSGDTPVAVAYQHVREDPVPPSRIEPEVSESVDAIVLTAMAKNPANRYASAADMRLDIERALAGQPVEANPVLAEESAGLLPPPPTTVLIRQPPPRRGRALAYSMLAVATLLVFFVALLLARSLLSGGSSDVNTPNVIGQTLSDATATLQAHGLKVGKVKHSYSTTVAADHVISQTPEPQILLSKGSSVDLEVSLGIHNVAVPSDLIGLTKDDASKNLAAVGLKVKQVVPRNSNQPAGQVLDVNPPGGTQVPIGSGVTLVVSNGMVQVPNVVGKTVQEAAQALAAAGFQVNVTPPTSPPTALVVSQNPAAGSFAPYSSPVTLQTNAPTPSPTPSGTPTPTPTDSTTPSPSPSPSSSPTPSPTST
ncbi:MAG: Stk1 family PASTA domain-containing Ser/Thr kinase [Frankiaceae bacterium]|nr:Stk1 family PASTA domain-containing Ser/Thr kinase [Frankiaceae bacterium]MBV9368425.1 Stk1 family PASTA domain-containing Ser/Thr kinase [Frankiales bacterium]